MNENYDLQPQYYDNSRKFLPIDSPITGKSVVQDTALIPIIPYSEPKAVLTNQINRTEFLKNYIGDSLRIKLNDSSIYNGTLSEAGTDFFIITSPKRDNIMMIDVNSVICIKVYRYNK